MGFMIDLSFDPEHGLKPMCADSPTKIKVIEKLSDANGAIAKAGTQSLPALNQAHGARNFLCRHPLGADREPFRCRKASFVLTEISPLSWLLHPPAVHCSMYPTLTP
jgi:hypothetical protein